MLRLAVAAAVAALALVVTSPASATIHPIVPSFVCSSASFDVANPPGQTPGANHSDQSTLRALQATGVLTFTASGPVLDLTRPASKFTTFDPATDTGTSDHPSIEHCQGG
jgi:hypothetical protein